MAFGSGKSDSSNNSNSSTNQTQTVTPTNPSWVTNGVSGIAGTLSNLNGLDPYSLVPGANDLQRAAGSTLQGPSGLNVTSQGDLGGGADILRNSVGATPTIAASANAPATSQLISHFMNPNLQSVVNPSLAAFDFGAGQNMAQQQLTQAGTDSAFGGSGAALAQAATASQNNLQRGQLAAGLYGNAFDNALQGAENQGNLIMQARQQNLAAQQAQADAELQNRQLQQSAGTGLANLGLAYDSNLRANSGALQGAGNNLYGIAQNQAQAPLSLAGSLANFWGQLPLNLFQGQTGNLTGTNTGHSTGSNTNMSLSVG